MTVMGHVRLLVAFLLGVVLVGCGSKPPPPPPPTLMQLSLKADILANPDQSGRPSPIVVRIYQLAGTGAFSKADFFQLNDKDAATLTSDLLGRDQIVLAPGDSKSVTIEGKPGITALGLTAAYQNINHAVWRTSLPVLANSTTNATVVVGPTAIAVSPDR